MTYNDTPRYGHEEGQDPDAPVEVAVLSVRYHPEVQHVSGAAWTPPSVGNIKNGYATPEEVADLFKVLREHDGEYYTRATFRIAKKTHEVIDWTET